MCMKAKLLTIKMKVCKKPMATIACEVLECVLRTLESQPNIIIIHHTTMKCNHGPGLVTTRKGVPGTQFHCGTTLDFPLLPFLLTAARLQLCSATGSLGSFFGIFVASPGKNSVINLLAVGFLGSLALR